MSDTKLTYELDGSGRIMVKATNQGVLLSKEEAERVVAHIDELERSYAILQNHFDKTRQRWIMRGEHISKQRKRTEELERLIEDMWSELLMATGAKEATCGACGRQVVAFSRGEPRKYCCDACRKWASRNPGETRPMREDVEPDNFMWVLRDRMVELGLLDGDAE